MNILKLEIKTSPGNLIIWQPPFFLLQAATDPKFPNKWSIPPSHAILQILNFIE